MLTWLDWQQLRRFSNQRQLLSHPDAVPATAHKWVSLHQLRETFYQYENYHIPSKRYGFICTIRLNFWRTIIRLNIAKSVFSSFLGDFHRFWATVCETVRPMLSDRCLSCPVLSVLFAPLVYCGPTVGRIKMKLGVQVGLGPGHTVLSGDPAPPPQGGIAPQFSAHICWGQMAAWIKMPLGMELILGPGDFVLDGDPAPPSQNGFRPMFIGAKRLDGSRWYLARK